ncbi:MAG: hypothetical protein K6C69_02060 [Lachnospiraceae bacterium]|nr:hypothetical protein [Lachnospiraceae bacterium]
MKSKNFWLALSSYVVLGVVAYYSYQLFLKCAKEQIVNDVILHIRGAVANRGYSLAHALIRICFKTPWPEELVALFLTLATLGACIAIAWMLRFLLRTSEVSISWGAALLFGISVMFLTQIYIPGVMPHFYVHDSIVTQPWHNTTFVLMRVFGYLTLAFYYWMYPKYQDRIPFRYYAFFTIALTLTNYSKPNFLLGFAPVMLLFLVIDFIRVRGKNLVPCVKFGVCVLLSLPIVIYQTTQVYDDGSSIVFSLFEVVVLIRTPQYLWVLVSNLLFPVIVTAVLIHCYRKQKRSITKELWILIQAWVMFLLGYAQKLMMFETGPRAGDGNYSWGVLYFAGALFVVCMLELIRAWKLGILKSKVWFSICLLSYGCFVASGIAYFVKYYCGGFYIL